MFYSFAVFGLDILTSEQIFGQEIKGQGSEVGERVILPDTTHYIEELSLKQEKRYPSAIFPKYNNYVKNPATFDATSKMLAPLSVLGMRVPKAGQVSTVLTANERSVVCYVLYRTAGAVLPQTFEPNLRQRYGVQLTIPDTVMSVAIVSSNGNVVTSLDTPVKYKIRVDYVNQQANPQCVRWMSNARISAGSWSREGCRTEYNDPWFYGQEDLHVNCTCSNRLGPVAVVLNREEFMV